MTDKTTETNPIGRAVAARLHARAKEPIEQLIKTLSLIKAPPALSAAVMDHAAELARDMASYYRSKAALEEIGRD